MAKCPKAGPTMRKSLMSSGTRGQTRYEGGVTMGKELWGTNYEMPLWLDSEIRLGSH